MERMNRRRFLQRSAAAGALTLTGSAFGQGNARERIGMKAPRRGVHEEIRVACVGFKGRGMDHIQGHATAPNARVVALCDPDENVWPQGVSKVEECGQTAPKTEYDIRRVLDDKNIDCISIATPNHWHALATIWACQAGKDVYVEKPCSHNVVEGRRVIEAARRYERIVQHGTQGRSAGAIREAVNLLAEGAIGEVYMARALCYKRRDSIGVFPDEPVPQGVHYDLWTGPAPLRPFNRNRFHYQWHWNWDYGNGDIGNQGVHEMDIARWGLGVRLPIRAHSMGGRYTYEDQGQTPNTQVATFQFDNGRMLVFEVRGRQTNDEDEVMIGNIFYGSRGYMTVAKNRFKCVVDGEPGPNGDGGSEDHFQNFHKAIRSRKTSDLNAEIEEGHRSAALCHLANVSYRLGRSLEFDPEQERCRNDDEANAMLTRDYRTPYVVPEKV